MNKYWLRRYIDTVYDGIIVEYIWKTWPKFIVRFLLSEEDVHSKYPRTKQNENIDNPTMEQYIELNNLWSIKDIVQQRINKFKFAVCKFSYIYAFASLDWIYIDTLASTNTWPVMVHGYCKECFERGYIQDFS